MKLIQVLSLTLTVSAASLLASCGSKSGGSGDAAPSPSGPAPLTGPTYADISPALSTNCTPCHSDNSKLPANLHFIGHEDVFKAAGSAIATAIQSTDPKVQMPPQRPVPPPLTADQKAKLLVFVGKQVPAPGAAALTFDTDIKTFTAKECATCHVAGNKRNLPALETGDQFTKLADAVAAKITATDPNEVMPPVNKVLPAADKAKILAYLGVQPQ